MNRGSEFNIKSTSATQFTIEGIASTPTVDRCGDEISPMGAVFKLPLPLLWSHNSDMPLGHVTQATAGPSGIAFRAQLIKPDQTTSSALGERLRLAWDSITQGLVRNVSIGFRPLKSTPIATGQRITSWEWLELSLCVIPAQSEAVISGFKAVGALPVVRLAGPPKRPGVVSLSPYAPPETREEQWARESREILREQQLRKHREEADRRRAYDAQWARYHAISGTHRK